MSASFEYALHPRPIGGVNHEHRRTSKERSASLEAREIDIAIGERDMETNRWVRWPWASGSLAPSPRLDRRPCDARRHTRRAPDGKPAPNGPLRTALRPAHREASVISVWGESQWPRNIRHRPAVQVDIALQRYVPEQRFLATEEIFELEEHFRKRHRIIAWGQARLMGRPWPATDDEPRKLSSGMRAVAFRPSSTQARTN